MPRLTAEDARRRFAAARVARLATAGADGRPHLVPVVFGVRAGEILTAVDHKPKSTTRLRRLRNVEDRPEVCLLADAYDEDWDRLWWVRADGHARVVPPDAPQEALRADHAAAVAALREKYAQYRDRPPAGPVIAVAVRRWTGWQASGRAAGNG